jgi:Kdo2-lipid IVA lauroyltransferase/acyltransferase
LKVLALAAQPLPWRAAQALGRYLGRAAWQVARRERSRALEHVGLAFPELADDQRRRLARHCFLHLGATLMEMLQLSLRRCHAVRRRVRVAGWERVEAAREAGRPILFVTGHCGNWELLAATISCRGLPLTVVARGLDEEPLNALLVGMRRKFGTQTLERGSPGASRRLLEVLRGDGALGILIDQDTRVDGAWVPFFGRPAYTPVGAAKIALSRQATVIPIFIERLADGSHLARFLPALELPADPVEATAKMTALIEQQIRHVPEQWVWMHRRWRRQPDEPPGA